LFNYPSSTGEVIHKPQHANAGEYLLELIDSKQLPDQTSSFNTEEAEDDTMSEDSTLTQLSDELLESKTIYQSSAEISG